MTFVRVPGNPIPEGAEEHWLDGRGGVRVRAMTAPALGGAPRGTVLVCPGRTEFIEKYFEVVGELQHRGFAVFVIDWRGQGLSDRQLANKLKGHFDSFDDPVNDFASALKLLAPRLPRPHILLAHSMGGAIALRALQTRRIEVDAAVFSAPMWGIAAMGGVQKSFARFANAIGAGHAFVPGADTKWKRETNVKRSTVTSDRERHARNFGLVAEDPRLALASPTIGWAAAAVDTTEGFNNAASLAHLKIPIQVYTAGKEALVDNRAVARVAASLPSAEVINVPGAKHEILMEQDEYRAKFWAGFDHLAMHVAPIPAA